RGGGGAQQSLGFRQTTTTAPSSSLGTEETTEDTMTDAYSLSPTNTSNTYSIEIHTDAMAPPAWGTTPWTTSSASRLIERRTGLPGLKGDPGERGELGQNGTQGKKGDPGRISPAGPSGLPVP
ncbi:unnamed protein product, partial [Coregonus sp. 'balchen']